MSDLHRLTWSCGFSFGRETTAAHLQVLHAIAPKKPRAVRYFTCHKDHNTLKSKRHSNSSMKHFGAFFEARDLDRVLRPQASKLIFYKLKDFNFLSPHLLQTQLETPSVNHKLSDIMPELLDLPFHLSFSKTSPATS